MRALIFALLAVACGMLSPASAEPNPKSVAIPPMVESGYAGSSVLYCHYPKPYLRCGLVCYCSSY